MLTGTQIRLILCLSTLVCLLPGCQSTETFYLGHISQNSSNFALTEAPNYQGQWETFDLSFSFQAQRQDNWLEISGSMVFGNYYQLNSSRINRIDFYLFFIDDQARVLETRRLYSRRNINPEVTRQFQARLAIPTAARAVSFGYDGRARGDGGDGGGFRGGGGGGIDLFRELPKRPE